jgi:hypothetical protein
MRMLMSVLVVCACGKGGSEPAKQKEPVHEVKAAPTVTPDAEAEPEPAVPEHGVPNSAVESIPKKNWPCRFIETVDDDTTIATTFEYGTLEKCWIPADLAGRSVIVGCPTKTTEQNLENRVTDSQSYDYSPAGLLIAIEADGTRTYNWDDKLVRAWQAGDRVGAFVATANGIKVVESDGSGEAAELDANHHIVHYEMTISGAGAISSATFTWKGDRMTGVQPKSGTIRLEYDCKKPPHR